MGTYLAMSYAARYPQHVAKLVLIASVPIKGTTDELTTKLNEPTLERWNRPEVIQELYRNGLSLKLDTSLSNPQRWRWQRITFGSINLYDVRKWPKLTGSVFFSQRASQLAASSMPSEWDFTNVIAALPRRATIIHGDDDFIPLSYHQQEHILNCELRVIHNAGHACWIDRPQEFRRHVVHALQR